MEKYKILIGYYGVELQQLEQSMNEYAAKGYKVMCTHSHDNKITVIMENKVETHIIDNDFEYDFPFEVEDNLVTTTEMHVGGDPKEEVE